MYSGMFRIGRESLKRDSRNTFGKSEEFSVKNRCVALRCVVTRKKQRLVASIGEFGRRSARSEKGVQVFAKLGSIGRDASILSVLLMP